MQEYILRTSDLSVGYNGNTLIHDINISVKRGQVLTLIGPNGSGKSTIIKTLTKYLKTVAGTCSNLLVLVQPSFRSRMILLLP